MGDAQLMHLMEVLKLKRIWAVNIGENFQARLELFAAYALCSGPGSALTCTALELSKFCTECLL